MALMNTSPRILIYKELTHNSFLHTVLQLKMCMNAAECIPFHSCHSIARKPQSKGYKVRAHGHARRKSRGTGKCEAQEGREMCRENLKLYLKNQSIIEENEKLRKMATLLRLEKLALMSQFQQRFSHLSSTSSSTTNPFPSPP